MANVGTMVVLATTLSITMLLCSMWKFYRVFGLVPFFSFAVFGVETSDGGGGLHQWFVDRIPKLVHLSICKDREGR